MAFEASFIEYLSKNIILILSKVYLNIDKEGVFLI